MNILVINSGSSSIKFRLFNMPGSVVMFEGVIEKIGHKDSFISIRNKNDKEIQYDFFISDHQNGIDYMLNYIINKNQGCLKKLDELSAVGHRVAHGGDEFRHSVLLNEKIIGEIEKYNELAPLHNPHNLKGIKAIQEHLPNIKQVAVFDTSFHQAIPDYAYLYALPYGLYEKYKIRRYGFHGPSHYFVSKRACELLRVDIKQQKIITCHLGNGSSIAAINKGKSIDTSMGFTPLEGLIMGTRTGDLDVGIVPYLIQKEKMDSDSLIDLFYNKSGLLGITGISPDIREIEDASCSDSMAQLGLNMFYYRVKKYIGAYTAILNGLDILVFTGGIGENSYKAREEICNELDFLGINLDKDKNRNEQSKEKMISKKGSGVSVLVLPTNEEQIIAEETMHLISDSF